MSFSLCINVWFDENGSSDRRLRLLEGISRVYRESGGASSHFSQVKLFDKPLSKVEEFVPRVGDLAEVRSFLERHWSQATQASIESVYPYFDYVDEIDETVEFKRPLTVQFNGADYLDGHQVRRFGHVEIVFDNFGSFLVSHRLIEKIARAETTETHSKWVAMIAQIARNYDYVRRLIHAVIAEAQPRHVLSCTESDVNPLVSHDIYHARLEDFGADLLKIAKLHEFGGVYFGDLEREDPPPLLPPWKQQTYGYWRGRYGRNNSEELVARLQPFVDRLLSSGIDPTIPNDVIEKCLLSSAEVVAEKIGESYLISSRASSMFYIEQPYLCLFEHLMPER